MKKYLSIAIIIFFIVLVSLYAAAHPYKAVENAQPSLPVYSIGEVKFSVTSPVDGYVIDQTHEYQASPLKSIKGVKFTIPQSMATGTNLSTDSYISIESIPNITLCSANLFVDGTHESIVKTEEGIEYSTIQLSNAGAGNRYEETIYARSINSSCVGVRYLIHYGVFENYPEGSRVEFNKQEIINQFDVIRKNLVFY